MMNKELQEQLFEKYPKIFRQKDLSKQETCMFWEIECNDGWHFLVDNLCSCIQDHVSQKDFQVEAAQVKQKFGGLRFYVDGADDHVYGMIRLAESLSYCICERCGATKNVSQNKEGWILTLCDECREKRWEKND
jgi:hypothetical protein